MTANSAKRCIVFIVYPGVTLLDVTGPLQVFAEANAAEPMSDPAYKIIVASANGGRIATDTGMMIETISAASISDPIDKLIVSGGVGVFDACADDRLVDQIIRLSEDAATVASTCMGAFLLAETGLLSQRAVTTHWRWSERLRRSHPSLDVQSDAIVLNDGKYWMSGGVTAGMDLALELIARDLGQKMRRVVAGRLLLNPKRPGLQAQYAPGLEMMPSHEDRFSELHEWILQNLDGDLSVERLADRAGMSPRNFARMFTPTERTTPAKAVEVHRVRRARLLLEESDHPLKRVAQDCGFQTVDRMRKSFLRILAITPSDYRARFRATETCPHNVMRRKPGIG